MEWYVTFRVADMFILLNSFPTNIENGVYYHKIFDKMYFKYLLIFSHSSLKNQESLYGNIWVLYDRIAFNHCEKTGRPAEYDNGRPSVRPAAVQDGLPALSWHGTFRSSADPISSWYMQYAK